MAKSMAALGTSSARQQSLPPTPSQEEPGEFLSMSKGAHGNLMKKVDEEAMTSYKSFRFESMRSCRFCRAR